MIHRLLQAVARWVIAQIGAGGYVAVAGLMAIESACIPLPSEIIMPFSGYLVSTGQFILHWAAIAGALGNVFGSALAYAIGYFGGRPFIERYGRYLLLRKHELETADRFSARYGDLAVLISRMLPVVRTFISLPAGVARMRFWRFLIYTFIGSVPWCYLLAGVGMVLGRNWERISKYTHGADYVVLAALAVFLIWRIWLARRRAAGAPPTSQGKE